MMERFHAIGNFATDQCLNVSVRCDALAAQSRKILVFRRDLSEKFSPPIFTIAFGLFWQHKQISETSTIGCIRKHSINDVYYSFSIHRLRSSKKFFDQFASVSVSEIVVAQRAPANKSIIRVLRHRIKIFHCHWRDYFHELYSIEYAGEFIAQNIPLSGKDSDVYGSLLRLQLPLRRMPSHVTGGDCQNPSYQSAGNRPAESDPVSSDLKKKKGHQRHAHRHAEKRACKQKTERPIENSQFHCVTLPARLPVVERAAA